MMHGERSHSRLSGSSLARRLLCPGSLKAEDGLPDVETPEAAEGTRAHEMAEQWLRLASPPPDLTSEEYAHIGFYVSVCTTYAGVWLIEERLSLDGIIPLRGQGSVCDFIAISGNTITVIDLKYGAGVLVTAYGNVQIAAYGMAACNEYGDLYGIEEIRLIIVQPRRQEFSEWVLTLDELRAFWRDHIPDIALALWDDPIRIPGQEQCRFCKASPFCPERQQAARNAITRTLAEAEKVTLQQKAELLLSEGLVLSCYKQWKSDVRLALEFHFPVAQWELKPGNKVRSWENVETVIRILADKAFREPEVISVPEAEKQGLITEELSRNVKTGRQATRLVSKQ